jgi:acyl transferase domain-containing protein
MTVSVAQLFPGQGSQWVGMGQDLLDVSAFTVATCDELVGQRIGWSVRKAIADADASRLDGVRDRQVILFTIEIALAALCAERGVVRPGACSRPA